MKVVEVNEIFAKEINNDLQDTKEVLLLKANIEDMEKRLLISDFEEYSTYTGNLINNKTENFLTESIQLQVNVSQLFFLFLSFYVP